MNSECVPFPFVRSKVCPLHSFPFFVCLKENLFLTEIHSFVKNYNSMRYSHLSCKKFLTPEKEKEETFFFIRIKAWASYMFAPSVS